MEMAHGDVRIVEAGRGKSEQDRARGGAHPEDEVCHNERKVLDARSAVTTRRAATFTLHLSLSLAPCSPSFTTLACSSTRTVCVPPCARAREDVRVLICVQASIVDATFHLQRAGAATTKRLAPHAPHAPASGDTLIFGKSVVRGADAVQPVAVRVRCVFGLGGRGGPHHNAGRAYGREAPRRGTHNAGARSWRVGR
jgi:hypothetical protein